MGGDEGGWRAEGGSTYPLGLTKSNVMHSVCDIDRDNQSLEAALYPMES